MMIHLINTIEVSPFKYPKEGYEFPEISDYPDPDEWDKKRQETLAVMNIDFEMSQPGIYLADIEKIDNENLEMILRTNLEEMDPDDSEDFILPLDGGIIVKNNNDILIHPNCCGTIGDIKEWQNIFENQSSEWASIWIGHPWILFKKENEKIQFSDYTEASIEDQKTVQVRFEIDEAELKTELEKIKQAQISFKNRISEILKKMNIKNFEVISEMITGIKE